VKLFVNAARVEDILSLRESYRREMNCQIVHDSLHARAGWTQPYLLSIGGETIGYGSVAVGGPWQGKPTIFEFYVLPEHRSRVFELFDAFLATSGAIAIEMQTNDVLLTVMLHTFAKDIMSEKILFHDKITTALSATGAVFRRAAPADAAQMAKYELDPHAGWVVEVEGDITAAGGILFHYNPPYGDIFMKVAEPFRRRGLGAFLVQELKRISYEEGKVPAARCNTENLASRKTLQRAGFVPCGHLLSGQLSPE
jgi:GNAT superfamily N-acetyltransferase